MKPIERIMQLMEQRGVIPFHLTQMCELGNQSIYDWQNGRSSPSAIALSKIADFFDVSVDYLLGRVKLDGTRISKPLPRMSKEVMKLIELWCELSSENQKSIITIIETAIKMQNPTETKDYRQEKA